MLGLHILYLSVWMKGTISGSVALPIALGTPEDLPLGKILLATVAQRIVTISLILDLK